MKPMNEEELDQMLVDHFAAELKPQEGRALSCFESRFAPAVRPVHRWPHIRGWVIGLASGAAAACVAMLCFEHFRTAPPATPLPSPRAVTSAGDGPDWVRSEQTVQWNTVDEGIIAGQDGQLMRQLRRMQVDRIRFINDRGETIMETVVPREQVMLIDAKPY